MVAVVFAAGVAIAFAAAVATVFAVVAVVFAACCFCCHCLGAGVFVVFAADVLVLALNLWLVLQWNCCWHCSCCCCFH